MSDHPIRLGTRSSPLALWQANYAADRLREFASPRSIELVHIHTQGDAILDRPLAQIGGDGLFTKEIQRAVLDERVDVSVHSLKDLPTAPVAGLRLAAVPERGPTGDAFVSLKHKHFDDLPRGAVVGTSSLRRQAMIRNRRPDLQLVDMRGNVGSRLRKLQEQNLDALILAEAGLLRLGLAEHITEILDPSWMLPAVGQGALGLECRVADSDTHEVLRQIEDWSTRVAVEAERSMLAALGGGCLVPVGVTTTIAEGTLTLRAMVLSPDGTRRIVATDKGNADSPQAVGLEVAARLLSEGAREILDAVKPAAG